MNWKEKLQYYENLGYNVTRLDDSKLEWSVFTKDFKLNDIVYWLGHDGVYGCMFGWTYTADEEMIEKKENLDFWKRIETFNSYERKIYISSRQKEI